MISVVLPAYNESETLPTTVPALHDLPVIVVGSKRTVGAHDERPPLRRLATFVFSTLLRFGFGLGVTDTHGVKAFHRASVAPFEEECHFGVDLFDTELILRCEQ